MRPPLSLRVPKQLTDNSRPFHHLGVHNPDWHLPRQGSVCVQRRRQRAEGWRGRAGWIGTQQLPPVHHLQGEAACAVPEGWVECSSDLLCKVGGLVVSGWICDRPSRLGCAAFDVQYSNANSTNIEVFQCCSML